MESKKRRTTSPVPSRRRRRRMLTLSHRDMLNNVHNAKEFTRLRMPLSAILEALTEIRAIYLRHDANITDISTMTSYLMSYLGELGATNSDMVLQQLDTFMSLVFPSIRENLRMHYGAKYIHIIDEEYRRLSPSTRTRKRERTDLVSLSLALHNSLRM